MNEPLESRIAPAFASIVDVALVDGSNGFQISRAVPAMPDGFANALVGIGNINHDGFDDFAITAAGAGAGSVYVIFGTSDFDPNLDVATLDGTNGFRIDGLAAGDLTGARVSPAGDFNKDGNDDFIFSAPNAGNNKGACFLILGQATAFPAVLSLGSPSGVNIVQFNGELAGDHAGASVSGAGDFNKDTFDDIIIGAPGAAAGLGAGYVVFGKAGSGSAVFSLSAVNGNNGFRLLSDLNHVAVGRDVAGIGDLNNDGFDDLAIGSASAGPAPTTTSYVVFGDASTAVTNRPLALLDGTTGFKINGGIFPGRGQHLAAAGDINDDGFDDFLLTSGLVKGHGIRAAAFAIFGHAAPFAADFKLGTLDGTNGFRVDFGKFKHLNFSSVSAAGDVNSDGIADFIVGSAGFRGKTVAGADADNGTSYVIFGHTGAFAKVFDAAVLEIGGGFTIQNAPATPFFVTDVGPAGDVNGDSFDDIIIGSGKPGDLGAGYVLFGQPVYIATDPASDAVKFSDVDGDIVTVKVGGHKLTQDNFTFSDPSPFHAHGASAASSTAYFGVVLDNSFANTVVKINAQATTNGDGFTHVGLISAPDVPLKKIKVIGDVDSISVGDSAAPAGANAIGTLDVRTLGPASGLGQSTLYGGVDLLKVRGAIRNTTMAVGNDLASGLKRMVVTGDVTNSHVSSTGKLRMTVNGDVTDSTFDAATFIRAFTITGNLVNTTVRAVGDASTVETAATPAIKKLVVKGSVENSHILAGYDPLGVLTNGHAGIHKIIVNHDWTASDLTAGVAAGTDTFFGTADDLALGGGGFTLPSRIDSISIKGQLFGTATAGDQFGFVAEEIGRFKVGGVDIIGFTPGANNDLAIFTFATTNDVSLHEVAAPV